jgi:hypothetical protein
MSRSFRACHGPATSAYVWDEQGIGAARRAITAMLAATTHVDMYFCVNMSFSPYLDPELSPG